MTGIARPSLLVLPPAAMVLLIGLSGLPEAFGASADWSAEATIAGTLTGILAVIAARLDGLRPLLGIAAALTVVLFSFGFAQWGEINAMRMWQPHPFALEAWIIGWTLSIAGLLGLMSAIAHRLSLPKPKPARMARSTRISIET